MTTRVQGKGAVLEMDPSGKALIIGERINPSGKPALRQAILDENWEFVQQEAIDQVAAGADILDVNVGGKGIDEVASLSKAVAAIVKVVDVPLCIDTRYPEALEKALAVCPGRPLVNSISAEKKTLAEMLPVVARHNLPVIVLCMGPGGIPEEPEKRIQNARDAVAAAIKAGVKEEDLVFDPLVMPVGADDQAGVVTLETIRRLRELFPGNSITGGASNISFGMPMRPVLNANWMQVASFMGMNAPITDPLEKDLVFAQLCCNAFRGLDKRTKGYMRYCREIS